MDLKYKKGPLGFMQDMRKAMQEIHVTSGEWCKAYDCGDAKAIEDLNTIMAERMKDFSNAGRDLEKANKEKG